MPRVGGWGEVGGTRHPWPAQHHHPLQVTFVPARKKKRSRTKKPQKGAMKKKKMSLRLHLSLDVAKPYRRALVCLCKSLSHSTLYFIHPSSAPSSLSPRRRPMQGETPVLDQYDPSPVTAHQGWKAIRADAE